jgi:hypothetical protein
MSTFSITGLEDAAYVLFREAQIAMSNGPKLMELVSPPSSYRVLQC